MPDSPDRWAHRRGEPRSFAACWIAFLLLAVLVSISAGGGLGLIAVDTYRPAARAILVIAAAGVAIVWPMVRLSQVRPERRVLAMLQDLLVVVLPLQALTWPQALPWMAGWGWNAITLLSVLLAAWAAAVGGFLALSLSRAWPGWVAMTVLVAILAGATALAISAPHLVFAGPFTGVLALTPHTLDRGVPAGYWPALAAVLAAAAVLWAAAARRPA